MTRIEPDALPGIVNADSIQIEEVLINLCNNAIYAMGEKGLLSVSLSKQKLDANTPSMPPDVNPGEYLKLCIEDTGSGMSKEVLEKIFDPFFTTKPAGHGTGMGLSISHGIIKNHGGFLSADSEPEHGSRFSLYLPRVASIPEERPEKLHDDLPRGDEKILLIDDEELLADSVADFLREHGYVVSIETDSRKALEIFQQGADFDLVVSDQTMPELTGMELARALMKIRPHLPIILCTGYSASLTEEKALQAGAKALFMKPLALPELTRAIRTLLDEYKAQDSKQR
jgi:CheY-like chemotaxis protein